MTARAAEVEDESSPRPGTEFGGRAGDLEEALGTVIAARVREFRLQLGWTVGQLAVESGISKGMLVPLRAADQRVAPKRLLRDINRVVRRRCDGPAFPSPGNTV